LPIKRKSITALFLEEDETSTIKARKRRRRKKTIIAIYYITSLNEELSKSRTTFETMFSGSQNTGTFFFRVESTYPQKKNVLL